LDRRLHLVNVWMLKVRKLDRLSNLWYDCARSEHKRRQNE
jgi:hypothetical protein